MDVDIPKFSRTFQREAQGLVATGPSSRNRDHVKLEIMLTPMAKESKNTLNVKAMYVSFVITYCLAITSSPGAIIELASGGTKVYSDT